MKNIHVVPTDKPSNYVTNYMESNMQYHNIYITSDEGIAEEDWVLYYNPHSNRTLIVECIEVSDVWFDYRRQTLEIKQIPKKWAKKIILTTDPVLIADGIQPIDDDFLQWFVKNANESGVPFDMCEVEINSWEQYVADQSLIKPKYAKYKIIIPKEEPKHIPYTGKVWEPTQEPCCTPIGQIKRYVDCKGCDRKPSQETLEEAAKAYVNKEGDIPTTELEDAIFKQGFIDGAKWQAKSMYSEEDIISLIQFLSQDEDFDSYTSVSKETAKYYLERFKVERL